MSRRDAVARRVWTSGLDGVSEGCVGRHEDGRRIRAVLGLGDEVGRDASGVCRRRCQDHALRRPGGQVDADLAADLDLRRGHPGITRPDDPVHGFEAGIRQSVRKRPDRLRAAGHNEGVDLEQAGGPQEDRVVHARAIGGGGDDDPLHARDLCRDDGHHQGRRIRSRATRDVAADAGERRPAAFQLDPGCDPRSGALRSLGLGEAADVLDRLVERATDLRVERVPCRAELAAVQEETPVWPATAESFVGRPDRLVAARADGGQRGACALTDCGIRHGPASDEGGAVGPAGGVGRAENQAAQAEFDRCVGRTHGTIFSIGSTRMPDAPAALSRGRRPHTSSEPTTEWIAIIPSCASGMTDGDSRPGRSASSSASFAAGAFISRYFWPRAAMTALSIVSIAASSVARSRWAAGFATRTASELRTSPIGRRPFITIVEPVETRSTMASASPRRGATSTAPEIGITSTGNRARFEEPTRGVRVGCRDPQAGQVLDGLVRQIIRNGGGEAALPVAEVADPRQLRARLGQQVDAGDAEVRHAVADELDDVVRAHEEHVEVVVLDARDETAVVLIKHEARIVEEPKGRFDQPSLVRDGQPEALSHRSTAVG